MLTCAFMVLHFSICIFCKIQRKPWPPCAALIMHTASFPLIYAQLLIKIKGMNSPVMTESTRNLYSPENHFAFYVSLYEASPSKKKKTKQATAKNKGADQSARTRRLICAFVVCTCIKESFLSGLYEDLNHGSSTSRTTFCWCLIGVHTWSTFLRG